MKKTLVIHPKDPSTDFLKIIYENHKEDWTVLNEFRGSRYELKEIISEHERIIMMGHGTPFGLLNTGAFDLDDWNMEIIDDDFAPLLATKETVSIWCNSDKFFERHGIEGFHTGMIISEVAEARYVLGHTPLNAIQTLANMEYFSTIIRDCIDFEDNPYGMKDYILNRYDWDDEVTQFNRTNIKVLEKVTSESERDCFTCDWCNVDNPLSPFRECTISDEYGWDNACRTDELENWIPREK